jgi:hypothetical protein
MRIIGTQYYYEIGEVFNLGDVVFGRQRVPPLKLVNLRVVPWVRGPADNPGAPCHHCYLDSILGLECSSCMCARSNRPDEIQVYFEVVPDLNITKELAIVVEGMRRNQ